ncbi:hypothetical protein [Paludifilum halophilum]|nr:hypothetical protein [Paludifilum halophilum]
MKSIQLYNQNDLDNNLKADCYKELGLLSYLENDLEKALEHTESGIDAFVKNGTNQRLKYVLYRNKAVYLEKMGRINEGMDIVQQIWDSKDEINEPETL